mmetsp:Transcript_9517/g.14698  ORF Transcript_9517/g.14698 Transcript_9517/m.14698 type:complete len:101 (+) Transcript_9517:35-337(+)
MKQDLTELFSLLQILMINNNNLFLLSKHGFFKVFPQNRKQNSLQAIGQYLCFQTTEHQAGNTRFRNDIPYYLRIRQLFRMTLFVNFDNANGIGAGITDCR